MEENVHLNQENEEKNFTKILLMGNKGVGKTSIKSIIFQNQLPIDTLRLSPTIEIEELHIKIIDCCSKEEYINKYFTTKKQKIFSHVDILLFVVDATEKDHQLSLNYFKK